MTDETEEPPKKKGKAGLIIGLVLAMLGGGGGFFAVYSGMILAPEIEHVTEAAHDVTEPLPAISFVPINPIVVTVGRSGNRQLRFRAELEVAPERTEDVALLMPRILDVLNGYLRAVDLSELENPASLIRLRAQMLRRVQIVTGTGHVRDLLITEFVFS
ncbi:flagellar FliL protein [Litoreibacter ascidiaceicola]|uniref:Flagellar protein FliL n=1 Tax=Litoreibacter ascidiaceicola TaxID=1486859 RepID=A0A1M5AQV4_9RHOB|nr:flagellar basal body-associated FliL family protein [Litoreibacter ascidiaceicola]SHF32536.1 flagellar FliL protein [Litoreibacter ascidiaceicola]